MRLPVCLAARQLRQRKHFEHAGVLRHLRKFPTEERRVIIAVATAWGGLAGDDYPAFFGGVFAQMPKDSGVLEAVASPYLTRRQAYGAPDCASPSVFSPP